MKIFGLLKGTKLFQNVILDGSLTLTGQSVICMYTRVYKASLLKKLHG